MKVLVVSNACQHLFLFFHVFKKFTYSNKCVLLYSGSLVRNYLKANNVKYLFLFLFATHTSFLVKYMVKSFVYFLKLILTNILFHPICKKHKAFVGYVVLFFHKAYIFDFQMVLFFLLQIVLLVSYLITLCLMLCLKDIFS